MKSVVIFSVLRDQNTRRHNLRENLWTENDETFICAHTQKNIWPNYRGLISTFHFVHIKDAILYCKLNLTHQSLPKTWWTTQKSRKQVGEIVQGSYLYERSGEIFADSESTKISILSSSLFCGVTDKRDFFFSSRHKTQQFPYFCCARRLGCGLGTGHW